MESLTPAPRISPMVPRSAARMVAIAAIYSALMNTDRTVDELLDHAHIRFLIRQTLEPAEDLPLPKIDRTTYRALVKGALAERQTLDRIISARLDENKSLRRLTILARACMQVGLFEIGLHPERPMAVMVKEYLKIGSLFLEEGDLALLHAVLDHKADQGNTTASDQ